MALDFSFLFKRPASKKEMEAYEKWAFPYGQVQREKLESLMCAVRSKSEQQMLMFAFLTCKEMVDDILTETGENELAYEDINKVFQKSKSFIKKGDFEIVMALIFADAEIDEQCNYPTAEEIIMRAENLNSQLQK